MFQAQNIVSKPMFSLNSSLQLTHAICHKKGDGSEIKAIFFSQVLALKVVQNSLQHMGFGVQT